MNEDKMKQNLNLSQGRNMSEAVMLRLVKKGIARQKAHSLIRKLALLSETRGQSFKEMLIENEIVTSHLSDREIEESLNPKNYLGTVREPDRCSIEKN